MITPIAASSRTTNCMELPEANKQDKFLCPFACSQFLSFQGSGCLNWTAKVTTIKMHVRDVNNIRAPLGLKATYYRHLTSIYTHKYLSPLVHAALPLHGSYTMYTDKRLCKIKFKNSICYACNLYAIQGEQLTRHRVRGRALRTIKFP